MRLGKDGSLITTRSAVPVGESARVEARKVEPRTGKAERRGDVVAKILVVGFAAARESSVRSRDRAPTGIPPGDRGAAGS